MPVLTQVVMAFFVAGVLIIRWRWGHWLAVRDDPLNGGNIAERQNAEGKMAVWSLAASWFLLASALVSVGLVAVAIAAVLR